VSHRAPDQQFLVTAGAHRVSVRGTVFRVDHGDRQLEVVCTRGKVLVSADDRDVPVAAGHRLRIDDDASGAPPRAAPLAAEERAALEDAIAVSLLPAWTDDAGVLATTSVLEVDGGADSPVAVDGVHVGEGSFAIRLMSGRHRLDAPDSRAGEWLELRPGARRRERVAADGGARSRRRARRVRRGQLDRALEDSPGVARCVRPLEKRRLLEGAFIDFDIGVNHDGRLGHLNISRSNMPPRVARCLRHVVATLDLPAGPRATVHRTLSF
jgi:hypothetical protein